MLVIWLNANINRAVHLLQLRKRQRQKQAHLRRWVQQQAALSGLFSWWLLLLLSSSFTGSLNLFHTMQYIHVHLDAEKFLALYWRFFVTEFMIHIMLVYSDLCMVSSVLHVDPFGLFAVSSVLHVDSFVIYTISFCPIVIFTPLYTFSSGPCAVFPVFCMNFDCIWTVSAGLLLFSGFSTVFPCLYLLVVYNIGWLYE